MPVTFGRLCLGPHIAGFLQQHPRVSLDLVLSDAYLDLATERIDVAVRIGTPANQPNLIVNRLAEHHRYVVASRDYLESNGMPASPDDLRNHQCLRFAYQAAVQRWSFTRAGSTEHVEINGRLSVNNSDVLREAVISGFGIALLPQWLVEDDVMAGGSRVFSKTTRSTRSTRPSAFMPPIFRIAATRAKCIVA